MDLKLLELAAIAVALDKEEGAERKRRRWAVHPAWSKREIKVEFVTLCKELIEDKVKVYWYFRINRECFFFCFTRESGPITYKNTNKISKAYIT